MYQRLILLKTLQRQIKRRNLIHVRFFKGWCIAKLLNGGFQEALQEMAEKRSLLRFFGITIPIKHGDATF